MKRRARIGIIAVALVTAFAFMYTPDVYGASKMPLVKVCKVHYWDEDKDRWGGVFQLLKYSYNKNKHPVSIKDGVDFTGRMEFERYKIKYRYENGRKKKATTYKDGKKYLVCKYRNGKRISSLEYYTEEKPGEKLLRQKYKYNSKGNIRLIDWALLGESGFETNITYKYTYHKNGRVKKAKRYYEGEYYWREYYNKRGLITRMETFDENGRVETRVTFKYRYDNKNRVKSVVKRLYIDEHENGKLELEDKEKYVFTYTKKKVGALRCAKMINSIISEDQAIQTLWY